MNRMIKSSSNELTLSDMISYIDYFVFYNNIKDAYYQVITASDEMTDEEWYLQFDDAGLKELIDDAEPKVLTDGEIHSFTNLELLDRLYKIAPDKLSKKQKTILQKEYKKKVIIDRADVQNLLEMFRKCNDLSMAVYHSKTRKYCKDKEITEEDCLYVIHHLTISDYVANTRSINLNHVGNNLIIFEPKNVKLSDGRELGDITVYVKLDVDETDGSTVAMISFHPAAYDDTHPYFDNEDEENNEDEDLAIL